jgi:hypothetical protein
MSSEVSRKPIIIFDTSGINHLADEEDFNALAAGLRAGYHTRLTGSNIEEIAATTAAEDRGKLLDTCQLLLASGDCIDPFNWLVEKHVKAFDQHPKEYLWKRINVLNAEVAKVIVERTMFGDELAGQSKQSAKESKQSFEFIFCSMRAGFDEIFANGTKRPDTFEEFINILRRPGGAFWTAYANKFYARNVSTEPEESMVRDFTDRCPPFLMMVMATAKAQYERAIVEKPKGKRRAGRLDLLMSIYLPYCRVFVTHDDDQEACLREMATVANLEVEVLAYREFRGRLLATAIDF